MHSRRNAPSTRYRGCGVGQGGGVGGGGAHGRGLRGAGRHPARRPHPADRCGARATSASSRTRGPCAPSPLRKPHSCDSAHQAGILRGDRILQIGAVAVSALQTQQLADPKPDPCAPSPLRQPRSCDWAQQQQPQPRPGHLPGSTGSRAADLWTDDRGPGMLPLSRPGSD